MNYKKLIGFGALIWGTAFITMTAFVAYQMGNYVLSTAILWIVVAIVAYLCGKNLQFVSRAQALKYSASWVAVGLIMDSIFTVPFTGWTIFSAWELWLGYILVLVVPLFTVKTQQTPQQTF